MSITTRFSGRLAVALVAGLALATLAPAASSSARSTTLTRHQKAARAFHTAAGQVRTVNLPTGFRPEGIAAGRGKTFYAGSVSDGRIWTGTVKSDRGRQLLAPVSGRSLRGLLFDRRSGLLWAVGTDGGAFAGQGLILAVHGRTGAVRATIHVPDAGFLNDLTFSKGSLWVTDSNVDRLLRVRLDRHRKPTAGYTTLALTGDWPATSSGFGANGIRTLKGGKLILDNSNVGGLYVVNLRTGAAKALTITGSPAIISGDGLVLRGRTLYVVRGSNATSVTQVKLTRSSTSGLRARVVRTLTDSTLDMPSTAALIGGKLWVVNARFGVTDPDVQPFWVTGLRVGGKH